MSSDRSELFANSMLATAAAAQLDDILDTARVSSHNRGDQLYATGDVVGELVFPLNGMISMTLDTKEGTTVEVAIVGAEGFVGVDRYLGTPTASTNAVVQVAGEMAHVRADEVIRGSDNDGPFKFAVAQFVRSLLVETTQTAVCNQLHSVEQRTSRWLLHASDRAATNDLLLTHEFLAQMLAVRRPSVTTVVGIFARANLISTQRGLISIADREGLRGLACECYDIVRAARPDSLPAIECGLSISA